MNYRTSSACQSLQHLPSTSTPKAIQSTKRKNEKKIDGEIAGLLEESKKARKEIERHLKEKRSVADAFFESCALRMEKLPQKIQSFVQLQISQIFINAENPTLQMQITPLPQHIANNIQQPFNTPQPYHPTGNSTPHNYSINTTPHSYLLSENSTPQQYHSNNTTPEPYHISGNTTPEPHHSLNVQIMQHQSLSTLPLLGLLFTAKMNKPFWVFRQHQSLMKTLLLHQCLLQIAYNLNVFGLF